MQRPHTTVTEHSSVGCATGLVEGVIAFSGALLVRSAKDINRGECGAEQDGGWGCRAAHHRGDRTTRGDVIRQPQHVDPRSQAGPGALQAWARSNQSQGSYIDARHTGCGCESPKIRVGGIQKVNARFAVTVRGSDESRRGAHGTHPHICERHQPTDTVATNNHFSHVRGAKVRMPCCSEEKAQQLSRPERADSPEWRHSMRACSGQNV